MSGSSAASVTSEPKTPQYQLSDDLARLCLPSEYKDATRTLAWVNSICLLFLVIGLIGVKQPIIVKRPLSEIVEPVAVELPPPQEQPQIQPDTPPEETPQETTTDVPQVVAVVAAADPSQVAFAVPVVGAVATKEARFATPPPPVNFTPPKLTRFDPNAMHGGSFPEITYPGSAQRNKQQGTCTLIFEIDPNGAVKSVKLEKTSGFKVLDDAAFNAVTNRWRFPAGSPGLFVKDFQFKLD
jgi:protein TonB